MSQIVRAAPFFFVASGLVGLYSAWHVFSLGLGSTDLGFELWFEPLLVVGASILAVLSILLLFLHRVAVLIPFLLASGAFAGLEVPPIVPIRHFSDVSSTAAAVLALVTLVLLVASKRAEPSRRVAV